MKHTIFFIIIIFVGSALAQANNFNHLQLSRAKKITEDFFILPKDSNLFRHKNSRYRLNHTTNCREHISQIMCLVEPQKEGQTGPRNCIQEDLSASIQSLQKVHDAFPPALAKVFCSLDTIYVERDFFGTAYAGKDEDSNKAIMGIRESALRENFQLEKWISWKEQLSFGGHKQGYESKNDLVKVHAKIETPNNANDFLYFVIAHEFGHIYDFSNNVNSFDCTNPDSTDLCPAQKNTWSIFSWDFMLPNYESNDNDPWGLLAFIPNATGSFLYREELCFYGCREGHGNPTLMQDLYSSIQKSTLLTTYSATNPWDDFAEATAFWAAASKYPTQYEVILPSGEKFDLADKYKNSSLFKQKREWLEQFYFKFD